MISVVYFELSRQKRDLETIKLECIDVFGRENSDSFSPNQHLMLRCVASCTISKLLADVHSQRHLLVFTLVQTGGNIPAEYCFYPLNVSEFIPYSLLHYGPSSSNFGCHANCCVCFSCCLFDHPLTVLFTSVGIWRCVHCTL